MGETTERVTVVGGGLAGCEAAWQLARRGVPVDLYEMRPVTGTAAHATGDLAELVCSNSFRSQSLTTGAGLLKEEMRRMGSLIIALGEAHQVPAGSALAVDRTRFARAVSEQVAALPGLRLIRRELEAVPPGLTILATGPLTAQPLSERIGELLGTEHLYYYDAISPVVTAESVDAAVAFRASRYDERPGDYLNLPLTQADYYRLVDAVVEAEKVPVRSFERFFEGCLPVEEMARRGRETLAFGPMRPTGLVDPASGRRPYAVVQLRQENREGTLYNLVGFQTKMTYPEQKRVFSLIPGLTNAVFVRYGSLHRNTFINAPRHLQPTLQWRGAPRLFFAGQITGVEGYIESAASGLLAGINAGRLALGENPVTPPGTTALGSLLHYISDTGREAFQPMNVNFGLFPNLPVKARGRRKKELMAERSLRDLERWCLETGEGDLPSAVREA
ncbi:MAG: methylenetetrahydrofolate--tRNA-(uracil(54)-C(5))-methyltransferase (FADH(2)-oxidizing) TrmFO [Deltaproteobacteria bacterium]|nr:methylenetetrahydrofolate--tRNA-(uracil(54)-C(5))-methyltransferase (FADH(2)-oxidizing) TrmFO [Deltaproteobacteria bacterium]